MTPWNSPGQNTGVGSCFLLQDIFPTQGLNPGLPHVAGRSLPADLPRKHSFAKFCPTLCNLMNCSMPGFPVPHCLLEFALTHAHWVGDAIQPTSIFCHPLLLLPSIFLSLWVFSNELVLCIRWPKYGRFSINPSNEYLGLISFGIDWFDLPVQGTLKSLPSN